MSIRLHEHRIERIRNLVQSLPANTDIDKHLLCANLKNATFDETNVMDDLFSFLDASTQKNVREIFCGAHVVLVDSGYYYRQWRKLSSAEERKSSHDSDDDQYEISGPCCHTILFGVWGNHTWLQMENNSWSNSKIGHAKDYVEYKKTSRNQGPYGSSAYTDQHDLRILTLTDDD